MSLRISALWPSGLPMIALFRGRRASTAANSLGRYSSRILAGESSTASASGLPPLTLSPPRFDTILNPRLAKSLCKDALGVLWQTRLGQMNAVGAVLPPSELMQMRENSAGLPTMIIPVRRATLIQLYWVQLAREPGLISPAFSAHFTPLAGYKALGPQAPVHLVVHGYSDLAESHESGLLFARYAPSALDLEIAGAAMETLRWAYASDEGLEWTRRFHKAPFTFDFDVFMNSYMASNSLQSLY